MSKDVTFGKTIYLEDNEDFDSLGTPKSAAQLLAEAPQGIMINSRGEQIEPPKQATPIQPVGIANMTPVAKLEVVETKEEPTKEEPIEKKSLKLAKKLLDEAKEEPEELLIPLVEDENIEKEVEVDLYEDLKEVNMADILEEDIAEPKRKAKVVAFDKLNVVNKTEMDKERDLRNALFGRKAAYQIVAAQSGYVAKVLPLVHKDIINILNDKTSRFERQKDLYRVIFEKVHETSVGKMSFEQWLRNTTVEDIETFYYGIYSSTFPNEGSFRYTCPACGEEHDYKVSHHSLIKTTDQTKMKELMEKVSRESVSMERMEEFSLIGKNEAIQLSDSGIVFELRTPSLFDLLEILRTVPEKTINRDAESIVYMLYVNRIAVPDKEKLSYAEEVKKSSILRIIDNLGIDDANEFKDAVDERVEENRITYSLKNIKCAACEHEVKEVPLSIENILFTLIFEKAQ